jgi:chemotaxis protein CheX
MDLNYINPFVQSAIDIIKELIGIDVRKSDVFVQKGRKSKGGVGIVLDVFKDVDGRIIFDFTSEITERFAQDMIGINISNEEELVNNKELLESAIKELGNMISGRAVTLLEQKNYNCDIMPPSVYMGRDQVLAEKDVICIVIDFITDFGGFSLCLTNKQSRYMDSVSFALCGINHYIQDALVFSFLPKGFEMYEVNDRTYLESFLKNKNIDFLLIDTDPIEENLKERLSQLKEASKEKSIKIIAYSSQKDASVFEDLFEVSVDFVVNKRFNEIDAVNIVKKYFERIGIRHTERRKHVRLDLVKESNAKIFFQNTLNNRSVEGEIHNLSIGGALFHVNDMRTIEELKIGSKIESVQMTLEGKIIRGSAVVVYRKEFLSAIRFINLKENFIKVIAKFIFKKLSEAVTGILKG